MEEKLSSKVGWDQNRLLVYWLLIIHVKIIKFEPISQ